MQLEIDQSGKIEQTNKNTILCLTNDKSYCLVIPARIKRQLQKIFRFNNQARNFILFTFSAGLAILIRQSSPGTKVLIDEEYIGKSPIIKNIIFQMLEDLEPTPTIAFKSIGKSSPAHLLAKEVALKRKKADKTVSFKEIIREIKKTEVGKRLKNA